MTPRLYFDGTDQYIMVRIGGIDASTGAQSILTGEINGEELDECILVWSEYKKDDIPIDNPSVIWNSFAGMWKVEIPSEYISQSGSAWINISGTDIIPLAVEVFVGFGAFDIETPLNAVKIITDQLTLTNIKTQVDQAISDYDPPTKAEFDSVIASLNNLSSSQVFTQVTNALNVYDPPTKAELDSAFNSIPTTSEILAAFDNEIVDGTYTRIQVERIIAAVLLGIRTRIDGRDRFTGLDGLTTRLVVELAPNNRSIVSRDGD